MNNDNNDSNNLPNSLNYIDLFCGIGGFHLAVEAACQKYLIQPKCLFSCDIDAECRKAYKANFNTPPASDITKIPAESVPNHDILLAGFPCQPFSIIGQRKGFEDTRGTLFFNIAQILQTKQPSAFILENVKLLAGHNKGETLSLILETLDEIGYQTDFKILNALDFGLPQKRERIFIVGFKKSCNFNWPSGNIPMMPLSNVLEKKAPKKVYASDHIRNKRLSWLKPTEKPMIWHENKGGHVSAYPYSCALRAGASYNYLLVDGERRLTSREMLRLQGFPDSFIIVCNDHQTRKQTGNSLPVPVASAVIENVIAACAWEMPAEKQETTDYFAIDSLA